MAPKKLPRGRPPAKLALGRFVHALREVNRKVSAFKLQGRKHYYSISEVRSVWVVFGGQCADCGLVLSPTGYAADSVRFVHRIPLKRGGKVQKGNLIPLCEFCSKNRERAEPLPRITVVDYNSLADQVVQLVWAAMCHDEKRIAYFKRSLDLTLAQFVQELSAIPIGLDESVLGEPVQGESTVSDYVVQITDKLAKLFEEIGYSKQYKPTRKGNDSINPIRRT